MRKILYVIAAIAVGVACFTFTPIAQIPYSCAYCRLWRVDCMVLGFNVHSDFYANECSRWYSAHVEQSHNHLWAHGSHVYERNFFGIIRSVPQIPGHLAINMLPTSTQLRVYMKFKDPFDAKPLFESLAYEWTNNNQEDDGTFDPVQLKAMAISAWESSGFPGTWDEWWERYYAEYSDEIRKVRLQLK